MTLLAVSCRVHFLITMLKLVLFSVNCHISVAWHSIAIVMGGKSVQSIHLHAGIELRQINLGSSCFHHWEHGDLVWKTCICQGIRQLSGRSAAKRRGNVGEFYIVESGHLVGSPWGIFR